MTIYCNANKFIQIVKITYGLQSGLEAITRQSHARFQGRAAPARKIL